MSITNETVDRMAALSRLELSRQEREQLAGELETIVSYMDILSQLPIGEEEPAGEGSVLCNVLREDRALCSMDRSQLLSNAPLTDGETLLVPRAVD